MEPADTILLCHQSTSLISLSEGTLRLMSVRTFVVCEWFGNGTCNTAEELCRPMCNLSVCLFVLHCSITLHAILLQLDA